MPSERILFADDDSVIRATVGRGLQHCGYEVLLASTAEEAVDCCLSEAPDLAILDISMPGASGIDAARQIRQSTGTPVLFLTAYDSPGNVTSAVDAGALGYLVKPVEVRSLLPAINAAVARGRELASLLDTHERMSAAVDTNRDISVAVGLLMARYGLSRQQAFEGLRSWARSGRRKLLAVSLEIIQAHEAMALPEEILERVRRK